MSHFTVLVIGENPEEQLAPFDENLDLPRYVKGTKEQLIKEVREEIAAYDKDVYQKYLKDPIKYSSKCTNDDHIKYLKNEFPKRLKWTDEECYKHAIRYYDEEEIGENGELYSTRNNQSKWDWYSLGGRWAGFFTLRAGAQGVQGHHRAKDFASITGDFVEDIPLVRVDQCYKKDIDIDRMRLEERADAILDYQKFLIALKGEQLPPKWSKFLEQYEDIDDASESYSKLTSVKNLRYAGFWDWEQFLVGEERYIQDRVDQVITTFAVIKDGKWYERGEMGWWAVVTNEKDRDAWIKEFNDLFNSLPDDTLLSMFDCHI